MAPRKGVPVRWRAYSLAIKNEDAQIPEPYRSLELASLRALRVVEAVWEQDGDGPIGDLYTELGRRFHLQDDTSPGALEAAVSSSGLDPAIASAAEDDRWDDVIRSSMAEALELVGSDVGVPILVFRNGEAVDAISGPVMSPVVTGDQASELWDSVVSLARTAGFFELKRSRTAPPDLGLPGPDGARGILPGEQRP